MKLIKWYIHEINESASVKIAINKFPETWKIEVIRTWQDGFQSSECFDSTKEVEAYLKGFYDALPF